MPPPELTGAAGRGAGQSGPGAQGASKVKEPQDGSLDSQVCWESPTTTTSSQDSRCLRCSHRCLGPAGEGEGIMEAHVRRKPPATRARVEARAALLRRVQLNQVPRVDHPPFDPVGCWLFEPDAVPAG